MRSRIGSAQSGFSLVELMVAMVVTMMVSGAVYGLLAGGQTAFRREPELTDRQQNIRSAMDMIMRDIANAGAGMPAFMQTFTQALDACGAGCPDGGAPMGPDGQGTDELEMLTDPGLRVSEPVCANPGGSHLVRFVRGTSSVTEGMTVILLMEDGTWTIRHIVDVTNPNGGGGGLGDNCDAGVDHLQLNTNSGAGDTSGLNPNGGICRPAENGMGTTCPPGSLASCYIDCVPIAATFGEVVRYRIRNDANGVPVLQRFSTGDVTAGFQTVATGIEDLQVEYLNQQSGSLTPPDYFDGAPAVVNGNYTSLITEVRVTLSARSEAGNLQGQTSAATPGFRDALRGRLVSAGSPRNALLSLNESTTRLWR